MTLRPGTPNPRPGLLYTVEQQAAFQKYRTPPVGQSQSSDLDARCFGALFTPDGQVTRHAVVVLNPVALADEKAVEVLNRSYKGSPVAIVVSPDGGVQSYMPCALPVEGQAYDFPEPDPSTYLLPDDPPALQPL